MQDTFGNRVGNNTRIVKVLRKAENENQVTFNQNAQIKILVLIYTDFYLTKNTGKNK